MEIGSLVGLGSVGRVIGTVGGAIVGVGANIISGVVDFFEGIFQKINREFGWVGIKSW